MPLPAHGRSLLAAPRADLLKPKLTPKAAAALQLPAWESPRPETVALFPRHDRFYSTVALVIAALGAVIIFAFGQAGLSPFARQSAAAPGPTAVASPTQVSLPVLPTSTPVAAAQPGATVTPPSGRALVVANTGGDGVNLRSQPLLGDPIGVLPEGAALTEIGQSVSTTGTTWLHIRTADGQEGYIQAQFAAPAH
ncbi:MAG: SH3 domain-containing protein [Thermomicrobiales bacterium]